MSLTLGEKLRQAREERGFTLSEVSEQTRISPLYLESIENDDYRILPGGIFNKGFVKSYAKFVGLNEQEALMDYAHLLNQEPGAQEDDFKVYRPEVLTDDRSSPSMIPTVIFAVVILSLMTAGILFAISYLQRPAEPEGPTANNPPATNANSTIEAPASANANTATPGPPGMPDMATLKVEFRTVGQPVRLVATSDGVKSDSMVAAGSVATFEPKESLTLNYNRWNAQAVQLSINGKAIALPAEPLKNAADKRRIEFTISKDTLAQIWTSGAISTEVPNIPAAGNTNTVAPTAANTAPAATRVRPSPTPTPPQTADSRSRIVVTPTPAADRP